MLGATGSIGSQALDIISKHPELYEATVLSAGRRVDDLIRLSLQHRPRMAVIAAPALLPELRAALEPEGIVCAAGAEALAECVEADYVDTVLTATVGYSGLEPTVHAIKAGKDIALANKETLVVAGDFVNSLLKDSTSKIYPVDSEHSAVAQCLQGEDISKVSRLLITASGGPFRTWAKDKIEGATAADALRHPNWNMGRKITIDSATMLNKAFEIIEAHHLFGIEGARIEAVVHPQSIVHSMVEYSDGAIKAQLGVPDMHIPIAYALGANTRLAGASKPLRLEDFASLTFEKPDTDKFPCLKLAHYSLDRGGNTACVVNAANEVAVEAFLNGSIRFGDIYKTIEKTLQSASFVQNPAYEDYVASNSEARQIAADIINHIH